MCLCSIDYCDFAPNKFIPCISGEVLPNFSEFNIMQCNSGLIIILKMIQDLILVRKHSTMEGIYASLTPSSLKLEYSRRKKF
jgi:hypothetical protein